MGESSTGGLGASTTDADSGAEDVAPGFDGPVTSENDLDPQVSEGPVEPSKLPSETAGAAEAGGGGDGVGDPLVGETPFGEVVTAVGGLEEQVRKFHARSESQENIIRQMQSRIEQLQGDQVQALLKPVLRRLAGLHAQAAEAAEQARERGEKSEKDFDFFMDSIEEALGLIDVESVEAEPSAEFDSGKHHAARVVPTDDAEMDKRIHRVLRQGFTYAGADRVFLPAQVSVYRYQPPQ
ncbi:hypothetical protein GCM10007079_12050 [Nocardiopsis terrae]|uniref:Molecular chaperone GrpE (Heat shock protein) n=1 Tax=Nocardiopsis terrae TaxID=372655 RepID=A0ABR9HCR1_9ACTN|nr:nucleotide exchange factor GrpE [Nocardiopsis terrae]MBE1456585.1 molecular chaperone GrpE (heat shock protein) [Nocardiopsis terrae]GHC76074.1 hypothetical protein GCM10007079_12050 [Nocardiopsis terrae]